FRRYEDERRTVWCNPYYPPRKLIYLRIQELFATRSEPSIKDYPRNRRRAGSRVAGKDRSWSHIAFRARRLCGRIARTRPFRSTKHDHRTRLFSASSFILLPLCDFHVLFPEFRKRWKCYGAIYCDVLRIIKT